MSSPIIKVENLSKIYRLGRKEDRPRTLVQALAHFAASPVENYRRLRRLTHFEDAAQADDVLWALREVSFEVARGEVVGVIGRNGAGKSTLLKILSRIMPPTGGRAEIHGRLASLLEVGTGFHPELSGRDNIFLNGAILGMTRREIAQKFDEIVAFAEIEKFLDTPVKRYSSGMYVRLAFAVAAHLEPDILVVDEVLAVGDAQFQKKCLGKIKDVSRTDGRTVLFVSHNMQAVNSLCSQLIWLDRGQIRMQGKAPEVVRAYLSSNLPTTVKSTFAAKDPVLNLLSMEVKQNTQDGAAFFTSRPTVVELVVQADGIASEDFICGFTIFDDQSSPVFSTYFNEFGDSLPAGKLRGTFRLACTIPAHFFNEGRFEATVDVGIAKIRRVTDDEHHRFSLEFTNPDGIAARFGYGRHWRRGPLLPLLPWEFHEN